MRTQQAISVVTVPPVEPFTLAVCKEWLKVDSDITADDVLIATLITAARQYVEKICNRALVITTFDLTVDQFPSGATIVIPRSQLIAVTSIAYIDTDGASHTLAASVYDVDAKSTPGPGKPGIRPKLGRDARSDQRGNCAFYCRVCARRKRIARGFYGQHTRHDHAGHAPANKPLVC